jgi:hypothetical protein
MYDGTTSVHFLRYFTDRILDPGRQGTLVDDICADLPDLSCDYEDIDYDAASTDYCPNVVLGEKGGLVQIEAYFAKCPDTALVVSGYSEGATIIGNILAGDGGANGCAKVTGLSYGSGATCKAALRLSMNLSGTEVLQATSLQLSCSVIHAIPRTKPTT